MKANLVKMNIIPVNKPEPKLQTLQQSITGGQTRLISTIVKQEDDLDDIKPAKPKVHDVKDLISKASETNIKRENNDSIKSLPPPTHGGDKSKDFNSSSGNPTTIVAPNISSSTCDSKHSDLNVIKPNTTTTSTHSSSKQESLTSKSTSSKVKSSSEHHSSSSRSSHHHDSDRRSSKHSHRHDKHHSSSSSASKHHHSSSKKVVNTGVQCDELPKPLTEFSTVKSSTTAATAVSSLVGGIAPVRHRMFGMMGANPLTNVENSNYKYGHLMYVER